MGDRLQPGAEAPEFTAEIWNGDSFRLSAQRGRKLWLAFLRYAGCPLCNLRVCDMIRRSERFAKRGLDIAAVIQSPAASISRYVSKQSPPFPLLADPEGRIYAQYRVEKSFVGLVHPKNVLELARARRHGFRQGKIDGPVTRLPADFLIAEDGCLRQCFYSDTAARHIPLSRVEAFAD
jgi:peroxiredoxin